MADKKVGIFAGAFDPIHNGHIEVALQTRSQCGLDKVFFMVEQRPWSLKQPIAVEHRRAMVDAVVSSHEGFGQFNHSDTRFSVSSTLPAIEGEFGRDELFFIWGADVFLLMNEANWPGLNQLLRYPFIIFERRTDTSDHIKRHANSIGAKVYILPQTSEAFSSKDIRDNVVQSSAALPREILEYIRDKVLYQK